jgi:hypothetical protein
VTMTKRNVVHVGRPASLHNLVQQPNQELLLGEFCLDTRSDLQEARADISSRCLGIAGLRLQY